jgi:hypothetical protein
VGRSIGGARLGLHRVRLEEHYGLPRAVSRGKGLVTARYRSPGGGLWVSYRDDRVVGVGTSSTYYSTSSGVGPGVPVREAAWLRRLPWDSCRRAHKRRVGSTTVFYAPTGGRNGSPLRSIALVAKGVDGCA